VAVDRLPPACHLWPEAPSNALMWPDEDQAYLGLSPALALLGTQMANSEQNKGCI
jgi:hypothetical protein